ncbi:LytTR family two component transcriptional regulator [Pontibacter ummariensis]|uniref:Two component transcriptional regulator, LytTR family n=1 Tax=Pontibacter ummariensis TaxID=1610492 RepID=A0A239L7P0_9BACT|nr:LytTR family DNA-binding domain-containing protein [Pontibacter ummariensis]PRY04272.1 LytTR family two component transcriptional regulator [Pontibacter ummariensis]SNT25544.1 two component transcriptional regulator, LytTR family [Pontibacter ummariensis]
MKVIIIEDEQLAAEALEAITKRLRPEIEVLATLSSVEESVEWLALHQSPDLIFCDIHLSDGSSFEIFKQVEVKCPVIFTTAYNQYAIEAFQVNSVDYLLKPIKPAEVAKALKKHEELKKHHLATGFGDLQQLVQVPQHSHSAYKTRFLVKNGQAIKAIPTHEVAYFLAEEGVVFLVTEQGKRFVINQTLDQLEEQLDSAQFFRANRQVLVHIDAVQEVRPYFKGRLSLLLKPAAKEEQIISSSRAATFKEWLDL